MKNILLICLLIIFFLLGLPHCAKKEEPKLTIACAGDSIMKPIPLHLRKLLQFAETPLEIKDWAQGGLSSRTYQLFFQRHRQRWQTTSPDFILIQLGTNDLSPLLREEYRLVHFQFYLQKIVKNFKEFQSRRFKTPKILIATIPLLYKEDSQDFNRLIEAKINPSIKEIAQQEKIILVDNYSVLKNRQYLYSEDGMHPSSQGERILAKKWLFGILKELNKEKDEGLIFDFNQSLILNSH